MVSIATSEELKKAIRQLEQQQALEWPLLKEELLKTAVSLKPVNIIKSAFNEAFNEPDLKTGLVNTVIGLTTGIIAKKIILGKTLNPLSKLAGVVLEIFVANTTAKNANSIKFIGGTIINKLFNRSTELEIQKDKPG